MDLKLMGEPGTKLVFVVSETRKGRTFYSAGTGALAVTEDGHAYVVSDRTGREWEAWEIHFAETPGTELGRRLAEIASNASTFTATEYNADLAIREAFVETCRDEYGQDHVEEFGYHQMLNPRAITKGVWIDEPWRAGFAGRDGVYLIAPGTNSAYGNYWGGFPDEDAAAAYALKYKLGPEWKPVRRCPAWESEQPAPRMR